MSIDRSRGLGVNDAKPFTCKPDANFIILPSDLPPLPAAPYVPNPLAYLCARGASAVLLTSFHLDLKKSASGGYREDVGSMRWRGGLNVDAGMTTNTGFGMHA